MPFASPTRPQHFVDATQTRDKRDSPLNPGPRSTVHTQAACEQLYNFPIHLTPGAGTRQ